MTILRGAFQSPRKQSKTGRSISRESDLVYVVFVTVPFDDLMHACSDPMSVMCIVAALCILTCAHAYILIYTHTLHFLFLFFFSSTISDPNTGSIVEIEAGKSGIRNLLQLRHGADNKVSE